MLKYFTMTSHLYLGTTDVTGSVTVFQSGVTVLVLPAITH